MSTRTLGLFLRHLALSEEVSRLGTVGDHDVLAAYESGGGQAAFTELMRRYGPMVLRTCCRVLGEGPDAEDAFQATFVLLARKAGSISKREALGGWLHRVAYRTAVDVLIQSARRKAHERQAGAMLHSDPDPVTKASWNELRPILDAELDALPDKARRLLIACYLQGKSYTEAAEELGLSRGSVAWHLERARKLLAKRLARRGITLSTALLAVLLKDAAKGADVPAVLLVHTLEAARIFTEKAAGTVSVHVAQLVKSGLAKMARGSTYLKLGSVLGGLVLLAGGSAGLTVAFIGRPAAEPIAQESPSFRQLTPVAKGKVAQAEAPEPIAGPTALVRGKVLDAAGHAVPFAAVTALVRRPFQPGEHGLRDEVVARGQADEQANFRLRVPADFPTWFPERQVVLVAKAPGHAPLTTLVRLAEQGGTEVDLRLTTAERIIRGRLLDPNGVAAPGVRLRVIRLGDVASETVQGVAQHDGQNLDWPGPVVSDAEGRFTLSDVDSEQGVWLQVEDDRYAPDAFGLQGADKPAEIRLKPAQVIEGRIVAADTGKAVAGVKLIATRLPTPFLDLARVPVPDYLSVSARVVPPGSLDGVSGTDGRFQLQSPAGAKTILEVHPPTDSPYLAVSKAVDWPEGVVLQKLAVTLPRGVFVQGRVVDQDGRPVAGASVQFSSPTRGNPASRPDLIGGPTRIVVAGKEGRFRLTVPAGPVKLMAHGPTHEYQPQALRYWSMLETEEGRKRWGWREPFPEERRYYTHAEQELQLTPVENPPEVQLRLVRGQAVGGRVVSPDGAPAQTSMLLCGEKVSPLMNGELQPVPVRAGRYELPGCVRGRVYPVLFLDAVNGWGAAVDLRADRDGGPEVKLARCGSARLRLLDAKGQPLAGRGLRLVLLTERSFAASQPPLKREADGHMSVCYDPRNYYTAPVSDGEGWLTLPALIPGARYVLEYADAEDVWRKTPEFRVGPDEQLLLPDLALRDQQPVLHGPP